MIASAGRLQPITPVELGSTAGAPTFSSWAVSAQILSAAWTPPGAHTLEILLLMMIAASMGSFMRLLPTTTGAPGKAFLVKTAAKSGVGRSRAIRVSVIFAGFGASTGVKSNRAPPTLNPSGSLDCVRSHARCAVRSAKTICVLDMIR